MSVSQLLGVWAQAAQSLRLWCEHKEEECEQEDFRGGVGGSRRRQVGRVEEKE